MNLKRFTPHPKLRSFVECYWSMSDAGPNDAVMREYVVADTGIEVFFNFGSGYRRADSDVPDRELSVTGSHVVGMRTGGLVISQSGKVDIFGVRFHPWGLSAIVPFPLSEITHRVHALDDVFGSLGLLLEEQLYGCNSDQARVQLTDSTLLNVVAKSGGFSPLVGMIAGKILSTRGALSVSQLCALAGMGYKRMERAFTREIGVTPKLYSRIARFRSHASEIAACAAKGISIPDGYYDQSHFIREFHQFAGTSPDKFFARMQRISGFILEERPASNSYNTPAQSPHYTR